MLVFDRLKSQMELPEEEQLVVDSVRQMCRDRISPRAEIYDQSTIFWQHPNTIWHEPRRHGSTLGHT